MYAHYKKLDYFSTECTYAPEAFRGTARELLKSLESIRPSCIMDIIYSGEHLVLAPKSKNGKPLPIRIKNKNKKKSNSEQEEQEKQEQEVNPDGSISLNRNGIKKMVIHVKNVVIFHQIRFVKHVRY